MPPEVVKETLRQHIPAKLETANLEAFDIGYGIAVQDEYSIQFA